MSTLTPGTDAVETLLAGHPDVAHAVRVHAGGRDVVAVVPTLHAAAVDLRDELWDAIPVAQLPDVVVVVAEVPDDPAELADDPGGCGFEEPSTPTEAGLAGIWRDVLGRPRVAAGDNFLDLGGDSMTATLLLDLTNERFGVDLTFDELLALPSLREVAATIDERR
jgi:acyl carrier protein